MSVALAEPTVLRVADRPVVEPAPAEPRPVGRVGTAAPARTRPRRSGPGVGPTARPRRLRFTAPPPARARACEAPVVVVAPGARTWHLTERGLAVVLVVAAALVAASVTVVALTALRVTGESYHPGYGAAAPVVVQP